MDFKGKYRVDAHEISKIISWMSVPKNLQPITYFKTIKNESESEVTQLCLTVCDPIDGRLPGFSVHGIFQARVLEWVAVSFSRGSSQPRDWTQVSCIAGRCFTIWATREAPCSSVYGILWARILECVAIPFSRRSSRPRDWTQVSSTVGRCFTVWATREVKTIRTRQTFIIV